MAGPSVGVRILADLTQFSKAFTDAGTKAEGAGSRIKSAMTGALNTFNQTGILGPFGAAIDGAMQAMDRLGQKGQNTGAKLMGAGGAVAGVGLGLQAVASKEQASHQQLQAAVEATGQSYDDYKDKIEGAVKGNEKYGESADKTQNALQTLTQATHDPQKALDLLSEATNIAKGKHEDLNTAAGQLGKVYNGNTKLLKEYGIAIDKSTGLTKDGKTAVQALADVTAGQASAAADTFTGKLEGVKAKVEDMASAFATKYGPAITVAGTAMTGLGAAWEIATGLKAALTTAEEAGTVAEDAAAVSEGLALAPILLIIGAIVILALGIYELWTHWSEIWGWIKKAVTDVWDWIKANWPLLFAILTGPIGLVVLEIVKHWHTILQGIKDVWNWIKETWHTVYDFLRKPVEDAVKWITGAWGDVLKFFTDLPGKIGKAITGLAHIIEAPFLDAWDVIAGGWNDTVGSLSFKVPSWVPGFGGEGFSMPHIPKLAAGGIVTSPTLALIGESGPEAVVPLGRGAARGPVIHIEHAAFNDPVDVELLSKQIEFALSAGLAV